jgi:hypothetical protein
MYSSVPLFPLRGAPAAIGEFMMMERALVAIGVGGIVDDGVTGSIMPLQDLKAIATAALALFAIRRAVERRGAKAVDRALAHFLFDQRAVAYATAYEQALRVRAARLDNSRP